LQGLSYWAITDALNDSPHRPRRAHKWHDSLTRKILNNDTYAGFPSWGGVTPEQPSSHFPALWDKATFATIRAERAGRTKSKGRRSYSMLLQVAYCDRCDQPMWSGQSHGKHALRCSTHSRYHRRRSSPPCHYNHIPRQTVIDALTELFRAELTDADLTGLMTGSEQRATLAAQLRHTTQQIDDLDRQRTRLALALAQGNMDINVYQSADTELKRQLDAWQRERDETQSQLDATPDIEQRRATINHIHEQIDSLWTQPPHEINALLRQSGIRVYIADRQITRIVIT